MTRPKSPMHDPPHTSETAHDQPVDEHAVAVRSAAWAPSYLNPMTIREKLARHNSEILSLRETLDVAFAKGARGSKAREDRVIFPLLVACRDIVEEILFAVSEGFGRLALRSVRTMYECVVFRPIPEPASGKDGRLHGDFSRTMGESPGKYSRSFNNNARGPQRGRGKNSSLRRREACGLGLERQEHVEDGQRGWDS